MNRPRLPVQGEEFFNEGASAVLDITRTPFTTSAWLAAKQLFVRLDSLAQIAVVAKAHAQNGTFDPTTGTTVCYCCGKPFWLSHGRNFVH